MDNKIRTLSAYELSLFSKEEKARFYSNGDLPQWLIDSRKEKMPQTALNAITGKKTTKGRFEIWLKNTYTISIITGVIVGIFLLFLSIIAHYYGLI